MSVDAAVQATISGLTDLIEGVLRGLDNLFGSLPEWNTKGAFSCVLEDRLKTVHRDFRVTICFLAWPTGEIVFVHLKKPVQSEYYVSHGSIHSPTFFPNGAHDFFFNVDPDGAILPALTDSREVLKTLFI